MLFFLKRLIKNPLFWIFVLSLFLRTYKLGSFPVGFHVDEAKVAWNAMSILKTGMDDKGNRLSLYYNSIGDYRPTGIFYVVMPFVLFLGRSIFAVRFASSLFGALTVIPIYLLTNLILKKRPILKYKLNIGYIASFLIAISPWHIEASRATSEVAISTFFALFAIYFFIKLIEEKKIRFVYLTVGFILLSYLLYHAIRFLAPPFFILVTIYYFKNIKRDQHFKIVLIPIIFVLSLTIFLSSTKEGRQRFNQVSIFNDVDTNYEITRLHSENGTSASLATKIFDNKYQVYLRHFLMQYGDYFSEDFLIGYSAKPYRYVTPGTGLLMYTEVVLLIIGLISILRSKEKYLPLLLLLFAPLPAALTTEDAPNLHRSFFMIPFLIMIEAIGAYTFLKIFNKYSKNALKITTIILLLNFSMFFYMYFSHAKIHKPFITDYVLDGSSYRDVGTIELAKKLDVLETRYDKIVISNAPDDLYPWYAFFADKDPKDFNSFAITRKDGPWNYKNVVFSQQRCPSDSAFNDFTDTRLLVIDHWDCAYKSKIKDGLPAKVVDKILRPSGTEVYIFLEKI